MGLEGWSPGVTARDAALYSVALLGLILVSLRVNPRIWIQDLPAEVRERLTPLSPAERRQRALFGVLLLGLMFGGLAFSALRLRAQSESLGFGAALTHVYIIFATGVLADTFVLDWLILSVLRPRFASIPETAGMEHLYLRLSYHLKDMWKGLLGGGLVAAVIAFLTTR